MKIAIVSDDGQTISKHFGRAGEYVVFSVEQEKIVDRKSLPKADFCHASRRRHGRHQHRPDPGGKGFGSRSSSTHHQMFEAIKDCDVVLSRGMGRGAYLDLQSLGIRPIVTDIANIDMAVQAVLDDTVINHVENLH